jgi:hypothetical protein
MSLLKKLELDFFNPKVALDDNQLEYLYWGTDDPVIINNLIVEQ